jgi:hypothetical protein
VGGSSDSDADVRPLECPVRSLVWVFGFLSRVWRLLFPRSCSVLAVLLRGLSTVDLCPFVPEAVWINQSEGQHARQHPLDH